MAKELKQAYLAQKKVTSIALSLTASLYHEIKSTSIPGVQPVDNDSGICAVKVKLSETMGSIVPAPSYYIPERQAELVRSKLLNRAAKGDIEGMVKDLEEMRDKKKVVFERSSYSLNPVTVEIITRTLREGGY